MQNRQKGETEIVQNGGGKGRCPTGIRDAGLSGAGEWLRKGLKKGESRKYICILNRSLVQIYLHTGAEKPETRYCRGFYPYKKRESSLIIRRIRRGMRPQGYLRRNYPCGDNMGKESMMFDGITALR